MFRDKASLDVAMQKNLTCSTDTGSMAKAIFSDAREALTTGNKINILAHWDATDSEDDAWIYLNAICLKTH